MIHTLSDKSANIAVLTNQESAVLLCLIYFQIFRYPLSLQEIYAYCHGCTVEKETDLLPVLHSLVQKRLLFENRGFYHLADVEDIDRRLKGNATASLMMPKACRYAKLIALFPFVDSVCISGSLSKNYFDEDGDVDFFIITKANRLWLCRSLLVGFKKVFLLNSRKFFCVNYFIDVSNLSIPDRNIFTATEIASLIPVEHSMNYVNFTIQNQWVAEFLPQYQSVQKTSTSTIKNNPLKNFMEWLLSSNLGEFADKQLFKITLWRWKKKFPHFNPEDFDLNLRSRKNVSKHHPRGFQQKVLLAFETEKQKFAQKHQIKFT